MTKPTSALATSAVKADRLALLRRAGGEPALIKPNEPRVSDRVPLDHRPLEPRFPRGKR